MKKINKLILILLCCLCTLTVTVKNTDSDIAPYEHYEDVEKA